MMLVFFKYLCFLFVSCRIPILTEEGLKTSVIIPIVTIVLMVLVGVITGLIICKRRKKKKGNGLFLWLNIILSYIKVRNHIRKYYTKCYNEYDIYLYNSDLKN